MEKRIVALDSLLEIQRLPLDKSGLGFQKCESGLHVGKNTKFEPKEPVENNVNIKCRKERNQ